MKFIVVIQTLGYIKQKKREKEENKSNSSHRLEVLKNKTSILHKYAY